MFKWMGWGLNCATPMGYLYQPDCRIDIHTVLHFFARAVCEQGMFHENLFQCLILIRTLESFPCIDEYQLLENIYALLILLAE